MRIIFKYFLILAINVNVNSQQFGTGILLDAEYYENSPEAAPLTRNVYLNLPYEVSLKKYTPTPGNQGINSTCAGWASAYTGRTILSAISNNWNREISDNNVYSPSFVYNLIRKNKDCDGGVSLVDALEVLRNKGALKINQFGVDCKKEISAIDTKRAEANKILEYREIFDFRNKNKSLLVKKSISESKVVIVAMDCPLSFERVELVWNPDTSDFHYWGRGHALAVVGYSDIKYGGAFELMNSWGTNWGNSGFAWVKYSDFEYFFKYGFELIEKLNSTEGTAELSGDLFFKLDNGNMMNIKNNNNYFETENPYPSGTRFVLLLGNKQPAYVYAFGTDLSFKTFKLFPYTDRMSALLPYDNTQIILPDENTFIVLDSLEGTSYLCFLYSQYPVDMDKLMIGFENTSGSVAERLKFLLKGRSISKENINYITGESIRFRAKSKDGFIVLILVAIKHL